MNPSAAREISASLASTPIQSVVYDSGNSGNEIDGASLDTQAARADDSPQAIRSVLAVFDITEISLTNDATAILNITLQDANDDGSGSPDTFADVDVDAVLDPTILDADPIPTTAALTVLGTASADAGQIAFGIMVERLRRHVRIQVVVTLSNGADSVILHASLVGGGPYLTDIS